MRRTRRYQILLCLLCLFPVCSLAQSLTRYEYWFDDNYAAKKTVGLSGTDTDIDVGIDASTLGSGLHWLNLRVLQSDGMYSPVTSECFFKTYAPDGGKIEYWFDGDRTNIKTVDGHLSSDGDAFIFNSALDFSTLTPGFHRMFYRFTNGDGTTSSSVSVASIIATSNMTGGGKLEYWFDDDRTKIKTVGGKVSSSGDALIFDSDLNLNEVSPGIHRMYYRLVDAQGRPNSAVSMTPVMVKSRFVTEANSSKVVSYSVAVDDGEAVVHNVLSPKADVTIPLVVDARKKSVGSHTVRTKFYNNLGTLVSDNTTFQVIAQATPEITLMEENQEGIVTLSFNSIPNDVRYVVGRKDADGSRQKVYDTRYGRYPSGFRVTDFPGIGNHTYYAVGVYRDSEGKERSVTSNEVAVSIAGASTKKSGSIVGRVAFGDKEVDLMSAIRKIMVKFSVGGEVRLEPNGTFYCDGIPLGTKVTVSIDNDDYYTYESKEVTVTEKTRDEVLVIQATRRSSDTETLVQENNEEYDLQITSMITGIPQSFNFEVRNTTDETWTGFIDLVAVKKKEVDKMNSLTKSKSSFGSVVTRHDVGTVSITNLGRGKTTKVEIAVTNFPVVTEDEYYYFVLVSRKNGQTKKEYKLVACQHELASNPKEVLMERTVAGHNYSEFVEDEINACVIEVLKTMKEMKQYGGPLEKVLEQLSWDLKEYERTHDAEGFFLGLPDFLKQYCEDLKNAYKDVAQFTDILSDVNSFYKKLDAVSEFQKADDFKKFIILCEQVIKYSNIPFASVYSYYFEVAEKAVEKIRGYMKNIIDRELATSFYEDAIKIIIEVKKTTWFDNYVWDGFQSYFRPLLVMSQIQNVDVHLCSYHYVLTEANQGSAVWQHASYYPVVDNEHCYLKRMDYSYSTNMKYGSEIGYNGKAQRFWAEITWKNGRVSIVPLLYDDIVDYESNGSSRMNPVITVTFESGSSTATQMADKIKLVPVSAK